MMESALAELKAQAQEILDLAKQYGATHAEVGISEDKGLLVNVRLGEVETVEYKHDKGFGVTVYMGYKKGFASTSDTSLESLRSTVQAACNIAQYTGADPYSGLADLECLAQESIDLDLYHPWEISVDAVCQLATEYEAVALKQDARISNSEGVAVGTYSGIRVYGNSHGFLEGYPTSRHTISCSLIAESQGAMQRDYGYTVARESHELWSAERVAQEAGQRVVNRLGATKPKSMHVPVLLESRISNTLIRHYLSAISGGNLYRHASFLLNAKGTQVFPEFIQIQDLPFIKKGLGSVPFDNEGVKPQERYLVKDGVCEGYLLGSYSARKLGLQSTGNSGGSHNVRVHTTQEALNFEDLLKKMDRGIVVTEFLGQGVNLVTGTYSRGACGFWVENGRIQYPLEEMIIAGDLKNIFQKIIAIGSDIERRSSLQCGSILIEEMSIAGEEN